MADQLEESKLNTYALIGPAQTTEPVAKVNVYAIVNFEPPPPRRQTGVAINYTKPPPWA